MAHVYPWKVLTTKVGFVDDADYVTTQVAPTDTATMVLAGRERGDPITVEVVAEYQTAADAVTTVARGAVTMNIIKVMPGEPTTGSASDQRITDSATLTAVPGGRSALIDEVRVGDVLGVRLTSMADPGGPSVSIRVSYRELPEA